MNRNPRNIKPEKEPLPDTTTADPRHTVDIEELEYKGKKKLEYQLSLNDTTDYSPEQIKLATSTYEALEKGHTWPDFALKVLRSIKNGVYFVIALVIFIMAYLSNNLESINDFFIAVLVIGFLSGIVFISRRTTRKQSHNSMKT